ncbi:MAG: hypothetical protein IPL75_11775 [Acidobacteria bacterium]|nr:hypothetical protein [Acidobacteriota bacterium]
MTCRSCGTLIADKAIVCYKCGMATMEQPEVATRVRLRPRSRVAVGLAAVVITALGAWLVPMTPEGTWMRWAAWAALPVVTYVTVRLIRGSGSGKMLRR